MVKYRIAALATASLALAVACWPMSAGADSIGDPGRSFLVRTVAHSSPSHGHLYVLYRENVVYRFPLAKDGLPSTKPDGELIPMGATDLYGLAVDKVGHVFVADANQGIVYEFAAGATGRQPPISILNLPGDYPDYLQMDDAGRLYVQYNANWDIAIFAKGAHGNDKPISIVPRYGYAYDYVIAKSGAMYVLDHGGAVAVYYEPLFNPSHPDRLIWPDGNFYAFSTTLAIDEATDRLYIQFDDCCQYYWTKVNYDVRPLSRSSVPSAQMPWIFTADCAPKGQNWVPSTVIIKDYLIVSCSTDADVFVYHANKFGRHGAPFEVVGDGIIGTPWEMAVGP